GHEPRRPAGPRALFAPQPERALGEGTGMNTVLVLLAADRITGPAKGLFQLFRRAKHTPWAFVLGLFHLRGTEFVSECEGRADELGIPTVIFEQARRYDPTLVWQGDRRCRPREVGPVSVPHHQ